MIPHPGVKPLAMSSDASHMTRTDNRYHALMPTTEWIAYWLDLYHEGWRTAGTTGELILVDGPDDRGPWLIENHPHPGTLVVDGVESYSAGWK